MHVVIGRKDNQLADRRRKVGMKHLKQSSGLRRVKYGIQSSMVHEIVHFKPTKCKFTADYSKKLLAQRSRAYQVHKNVHVEANCL